MLYMILGDDHADALPRRRAARAAHLAHLKPLQDAGRLILAGPRPRVDATDAGDAGFHGSLIVAEFDSLDAARAWAAADPYVAADVFARVEVQPFLKVLPA
jgi:uncharacterized protein YciI